MVERRHIASSDNKRDEIKEIYDTSFDSDTNIENRDKHMEPKNKKSFKKKDLIKNCGIYAGYLSIFFLKIKQKKGF